MLGIVGPVQLEQGLRLLLGDIEPVDAVGLGRGLLQVDQRLLVLAARGQALAETVVVNIVVGVGGDQLGIEQVQFIGLAGAIEEHAQIVGEVTVLLQVAAEALLDVGDGAIEHILPRLRIFERIIQIGGGQHGAARVGAARVGDKHLSVKLVCHHRLLRRQQAGLVGIRQVGGAFHHPVQLVGAVTAEFTGQHRRRQRCALRRVLVLADLHQLQARGPQPGACILVQRRLRRLRQGAPPGQPAIGVVARVIGLEHLVRGLERGRAAILDPVAHRFERGGACQDGVELAIEFGPGLLGQDAPQLVAVFVEHDVAG